MHYVLRASPDGEGNWHANSEPQTAALLRGRARSLWTPELAEAFTHDITQRQLPLIVDAGGKVTKEIEQIAMVCTHAILIASDLTQLDIWRDLAQRCNLQILAELQSSLSEPQCIIADSPMLQGILSGLDHQQSSDGVCFDALYACITNCVTISRFDLLSQHIAQLDYDLIIDLEQPVFPLPEHTSITWQPDELPVLLSVVPAATPIGIYGSGPIWLYAALAAHAYPAPCAVFDPRKGWVIPPILTQGTSLQSPTLDWDVVSDNDEYTHIGIAIRDGHLSLQSTIGLNAPAIPPTKGALLNGRLPAWFVAALVRTYYNQPFVAIYQPQLRGAVVVHAHNIDVMVGQILPVHIRMLPLN